MCILSPVCRFRADMCFFVRGLGFGVFVVFVGPCFLCIFVVIRVQILYRSRIYLSRGSSFAVCALPCVVLSGIGVMYVSDA